MCMHVYVNAHVHVCGICTCTCMYMYTWFGSHLTISLKRGESKPSQLVVLCCLALMCLNYLIMYNACTVAVQFSVYLALYCVYYGYMQAS